MKLPLEIEVKNMLLKFQENILKEVKVKEKGGTVR